jgi:hypothetical protein
MIDPKNETLLSLTEAAKTLPGRPNITTVWRWRNRGVRGVRLETVLSGGRRFTSLEAIRRFQDRVTAAADGEPVQVRTPKQRAADHAAAEAELQKAGW